MNRWKPESNFNELAGLTLIEIVGAKSGSEEIAFVTDCGRTFSLLHYNDCCESVEVDDVCGDIADLIGSPILLAEESNNQNDPKRGEYDESWTWTFYKLATISGAVTIRWYGTSNGYYSESVSFYETTPGKDDECE